MSSVSSVVRPKIKVKAAEGWDGASIVNGRVYKNHTDKATKSDVLDLVWDWVKTAKLAKGSSVILTKGIHQDGDVHLTVMVNSKDRLIHIPVEKIPAEEGKESKENGKGGKTRAWRLASKKPAKPAWEPKV